MKHNKKSKGRDVLAGKRDPVSQLYRAVRRYVETHGGSIVVIGGIQVLEFPGTGKLKFSISVQCLGRKPSYAEGKSESRS